MKKILSKIRFYSHKKEWKYRYNNLPTVIFNTVSVANNDILRNNFNNTFGRSPEDRPLKGPACPYYAEWLPGDR